MQTWKNFVATKNSPWTPRFGSPSIQFMIIFKASLCLANSLYYILVHCIHLEVCIFIFQTAWKLYF